MTLELVEFDGVRGGDQADVVIEEDLAGGHNAHQVVKVGETVRRSRAANAVFAAAVLEYLEAAGFPYAPLYLGVDEQDREILSHVPGDTTNHPSQRDPAAYRLAGSMLRQLHDLTAGHALAMGHECVIHGDAGPFNTIFRQGLPTALIDWDAARPGSRLEDLAYMGWTWCVHSEGNVPVEVQGARLRQLRDGYGNIGADELLSAIVVCQEQMAKWEAVRRDDPGVSPARRKHAAWAVQWSTADLWFVRANVDLLRAALEI